MRRVLSTKKSAYSYNSYDIVGDIAILRSTEKSKNYLQDAAEAIMNAHKNVKTVIAQTSPVHGNLRLRKLEYVAGEDKKTTVHKESECLLVVNIEECYFSPRLFYERMRIAKQVKNGEVIVNMFAGVGCFSIVIAKHSSAEKIFSIDINDSAVRDMLENVRLNRLYRKVVPILGDAGEIIEKRLRHVADRVLMPLPEQAFEYLPFALLALEESGGWIHYYDFEHAEKNENPVTKVELKVTEKLRSLGIDFDIPFGRVVRTTGPNWHQIALDIKVNTYWFSMLQLVKAIEHWGRCVWGIL